MCIFTGQGQGFFLIGSSSPPVSGRVWARCWCRGDKVRKAPPGPCRSQTPGTASPPGTWHHSRGRFPSWNKNKMHSNVGKLDAIFRLTMETLGDHSCRILTGLRCLRTSQCTACTGKVWKFQPLKAFIAVTRFSSVQKNRNLLKKQHLLSSRKQDFYEQYNPAHYWVTIIIWSFRSDVKIPSCRALCSRSLMCTSGWWRGCCPDCSSPPVWSRCQRGEASPAASCGRTGWPESPGTSCDRPANTAHKSWHASQ